MFMVCLTVSVIFIFFGFILMKFPPGSINSIYGYRTPLSMKNQDTWNIAQQYGGFSLIIFGIINAILGGWSFIQPMNINNETFQILFLVIGAFIMIFIDELRLRKIFNKDGSRKIN